MDRISRKICIEKLEFVLMMLKKEEDKDCKGVHQVNDDIEFDE